MRKLWRLAMAWLCRRPENAITLLAAILLAIDHRWSQYSLGAISLLVGVSLWRSNMIHKKSAVDPAAHARPLPQMRAIRADAGTGQEQSR